MNPDCAVWREALAQVPGASGSRELAVTALAGGTTNATFRVVTGEGAFVVRLHEPFSADLGVDRRREAVLHAAAAAAGLASRVLAADPAGRFLVSEFLGGKPWLSTDLADPARLRELAQTLGRLHRLSAPAVPPLDLGGILDRHTAFLARLDPGVGQEFAPRVAAARDILAREAGAGRAVGIVHGDPAHSNMIGTGPLRFIDWEYATVGDPLADLACLLAYYPQLAPQAGGLLEDSGLGGPGDLNALEALAGVYRLASDLWYRRLELARRHPAPAH